MRNQTDYRSILIVKTSAIGDVIQSFPTLEYLHEKCGAAKIDWVVEKGIASLVKAHPFVSKVLPIDTKSWYRSPLSFKTLSEVRAFFQLLKSERYDLVVDLQGNAKSAFVTGGAHSLQKVGFDSVRVREKISLLATNLRYPVAHGINIRQKYLTLVQAHFQETGSFISKGVRLLLNEEEQKCLQEIFREENLKNQLRLMVCFGSHWKNKQLDGNTLLQLLHWIRDSYDASFLFVYGNEKEKREAEELAAQFPKVAIAVAKMSLPLWQACMWEVEGVIAVDSAALHLCGTTLTPSFSFFGPSHSSIYKPTEERHVAVQGECPYGETFLSHCDLLRSCKTGACIKDLKIDRLTSAFREWATAHLPVAQKS